MRTLVKVLATAPVRVLVKVLAIAPVRVLAELPVILNRAKIRTPPPMEIRIPQPVI